LKPSLNNIGKHSSINSDIIVVFGLCWVCFHMPEFTELENWSPSSLDLNPRWIIGCRGIASLQQMAWSENFRQWPAEMHANQLLGWSRTHPAISQLL